MPRKIAIQKRNKVARDSRRPRGQQACAEAWRRFTAEAKTERAHLRTVFRRARAVIAEAEGKMLELEAVALTGEK